MLQLHYQPILSFSKSKTLDSLGMRPAMRMNPALNAAALLRISELVIYMTTETVSKIKLPSD